MVKSSVKDTFAQVCKEVHADTLTEMLKIYNRDKEKLLKNVKSKKKMLHDRIDWILRDLVDVVDKGNGCYNILYKE